MSDVPAKTLWITGCRAVTPHQVIENAEIRIRGGRIVHVGAAGRAPARASAPGEEALDAGGRIAAPGFIDLHVHGAAGRDVLDGEPAALQAVARTCARFGVTGFLATTVFRPRGDNRHLAAVREAAARCPGGADLLGLHLEGPFIAADRRGMIQPDCLAEPRPEVLERIMELTGGRLRLMTVAPELPGALPIVAALAAGGMVASFGHSAADYGQTVRGLEAGIRHVTHLFNAMPPLHHREPGPIPALLEAREVAAQVIFDGVHLHPAVLRLAARLLGKERLVLVSDGTRAMGLADGWYEHDGLPFEAREGTAYYRDGTLIGTALGLSRMVERAVRLGGLSLTAAVRAASLNPAAVLGLAGRKGSLEAGKDADLALLDEDFNVWKTIRGGEIIHETGPGAPAR